MFANAPILPTSTVTDVSTALFNQVSADAPVLIGVLAVAVTVTFIWRALKHFTDVRQWNGEAAMFNDHWLHDSDAEWDAFVHENEATIRRFEKVSGETDSILRKSRNDW